jgi:hypothetical protein
MKNKNYIFLQASAIVGLIVGILTAICLVGIPLIIGAVKYFAWAKMTDEELAQVKDNLMLWGIIYTVLMFPIGAISLVPPFNLDGQLFGGRKYDYTQAKDAGKSKAERISELNELKQKGVIDENDYEIAKNKIINE